MKTAGIAELKANLSRYLELVKSGGELLVTERGIPVARIVPLRREEKRDSRRERLTRAGLLRPGRTTGKTIRKPPKGMKLGREVLNLLLKERDEQR